MRYNNMGNVLVEIQGQKVRIFVFVFEVIDIQLVLGFVMGGNEILIVGIGFVDDIWVMVIIGGYFCSVFDVTYIIIKCIVRNFNLVGVKVLEVFIILLIGSLVKVKCGVVCQYVYDFSVILEMDSVFLGVVVGGFVIILIIVGLKFGSVFLVVLVIVGDKICIVLFVIDIFIQCDIIYLFVGLNVVAVLIVDVGLFQGILIVIGEIIIISLFFIEGSINGGLELIIEGNGFIFGIIVSIDGLDCVVIEVNLNNVICIILVYVVGVVKVIVIFNGQIYF